MVLSAFLAGRCLADSPDIAKLVETAVNGTGEAQYTAIDDLGERSVDATTVVPNLQVLLTNKDPQVRWRSARAIGDYEAVAKPAAGDLRKLLADSDPIVQYHAAVALGKVEDRSEETVSALVKAATSKDGRVARAAIAALSNLKPGPERVMSALSQALKSDDDAVSLHALEAIVELDAEAVPLLNEALKRPETAYMACTAIEHIGPDAAATVPALTELLGDTKHSHLLIQTLLALASIGPAAESASTHIVPLLEMQTDATVPVAAAYALGAIGAKDAEPALRKALAKDDPFLQMVSAWALAKNHPDDSALMKQAVDKLTKGLASDDANMRSAAANGLHMLKAPPEMVVPALMTVADDTDPNVVANVVNALASLGESIVPKASGALSDPELRGLAARVLRQLGPKASGAVKPLVDAASQAGAGFRGEINLTLAAIGPQAAAATDVLVEGMASDDQAVRESSIYALQKIGPGAKAAVKPLDERMQKDDAFEAIASACALAAIAPDDASIRAKVVSELSGGLSHADERVRIECAEALAKLGSGAVSAKSALQSAAEKDDSDDVRTAAEGALHSIQSQ